MKFTPLHPWNLTPREAIALQKELAARLEVGTPLTRCELIAGADVSHNRFSPIFYAGIVVLRTSDWSIVETQHLVGKSPFPYVPGLLSFRELPIILDTFARLQTTPDAVMYDGQGMAHPRRLGIAAHLGLWLNIPTIGCAKSRLCGTFREPGPNPGNASSLMDKDEVIGKVVRSKSRAKPLFVSAGNHIDLQSCVRWVLKSCRGYRVPEPTRQAHIHVNAFRTQSQLGVSEPPA